MKSTKFPTQLHYYKPSKDTNPRHLTLLEGWGDQGGTLKGLHTNSHELWEHQAPTPTPQRPPSLTKNSYIPRKETPSLRVNGLAPSGNNTQILGKISSSLGNNYQGPKTTRKRIIRAHLKPQPRTTFTPRSNNGGQFGMCAPRAMNHHRNTLIETNSPPSPIAPLTLGVRVGHGSQCCRRGPGPVRPSHQGCVCSVQSDFFSSQSCGKMSHLQH